MVDSIGEYELLALSFQGELPKFTETARKMQCDTTDFTIYYSPECPMFNSKNQNKD